MSDLPIWRYISFGKYIDLLSSQSLYLSKASLFQDQTEGKWVGHVNLMQQARRWTNSVERAQELEELLIRAGSDPDAILKEAMKLRNSKIDWTKDVMQSVLQGFSVAYPHKRKEYLELMITSWRSHPEKQAQSLQDWKADAEVYRNSTYISCWNRSTSMSVAMWDVYGGSRDAVAIRSSEGRLRTLVELNSQFLENNGLTGTVAELQYIEGLKKPTPEVEDKVFTIFEETDDYQVAMFTIKPSLYTYEQEVRVLLYPKRQWGDTVIDPHPEIAGFKLKIDDLEDFIDAIYIHPELTEDSMQFRVVSEINKRFGLASVPIFADRLEALGPDVMLKPYIPS